MQYLVILLIGLLAASEIRSLPDGITGATVTQSQKSAAGFWTKAKLLAAKEVFPQVAVNLSVTGKSIVDLSQDTPMLIGGVKEYDNNQTTDGRSAKNQFRATTGRVFWSCPNSVAYSCSASVIASSSRNLIVTSGHCVYDTNQLRWYTNCNWAFIPGYSYGSAPFGIWYARYFTAFTSFTQRYPNYNYDIAFVTLYPSNGVRIGNRITPQSIGFNYPYNRLTSSFGYPVNFANAQTVQSCTNVPYNIAFYINGIPYRGQALTSCNMNAGSGGGPWLQQLNNIWGTGVTYSVNSFTVQAYPNTMFGPMFDTSVYYGWNVAQYY